MVAATKNTVAAGKGGSSYSKKDSGIDTGE
jgi:hypothetical protein